jgi:hypothetical protein
MEKMAKEISGGASEMKVYRYVITNVPIDKEKDVNEALYILLKKGIITTANIHRMEEEQRTF